MNTILRLFVGMSIIVVAFVLLESNDVAALCTPDMLDDWPDIPCGPVQIPDKELREHWQGYYKFKGQKWMEEKRTEIEHAVLSGNLEQWRSSISNYNAWVYYKITNNIPEIPPLKQFKLGIPTYEIQCNEDLQLVTKKNNDRPACVKPYTILPLINRSWANAHSDTNMITVRANTTEIATGFCAPNETLLNGGHLTYKDNPIVVENKTKIVNELGQEGIKITFSNPDKDFFRYTAVWVDCKKH